MNPLPPYLRQHAEEVTLAVKVQPRAARNEIGEMLGTELKIKVAAPPVEDAANEALREFLARLLKLPRGAVRLVRGAASRHKTLAIRGLTAEEVLARLTSGS